MSTVKTPYPTGGKIQQMGTGWEKDLWVPGSFDYDVFDSAFKGDQLIAEYPAAKLNGASSARTFTEHNVSGFLELVSGTDLDGYAGTGFGMNWSGDRGVLMDAIVKLPSSLATFKFEVGVSDNDQDAGAVNDKSSPSSTADDYAVFVFDTAHNTSFDFHSDIDAGGTEQVTTGLLTLAASDTLRLSIRVDGDNVVFYVNDRRAGTCISIRQVGKKIYGRTGTNITRTLRS